MWSNAEQWATYIMCTNTQIVLLCTIVDKYYYIIIIGLIQATTKRGTDKKSGLIKTGFTTKAKLCRSHVQMFHQSTSNHLLRWFEI